MKITKNIISIVIAVASIYAVADDTPLVQALKTRDKIEEIRQAVARRGIECSSFDDLP